MTTRFRCTVGKETRAMGHTFTLLTSRIKNHWRERRRRSNRHYHEYLEFWRTYYIR